MPPKLADLKDFKLAKLCAQIFQNLDRLINVPVVSGSKASNTHFRNVEIEYTHILLHLFSHRPMLGSRSFWSSQAPSASLPRLRLLQEKPRYSTAQGLGYKLPSTNDSNQMQNECPKMVRKHYVLVDSLFKMFMLVCSDVA
ncbi:uncharacterized protein LOC105176695 isoform X2 [Sesamum indicum]|uniref:Uncharacterized protein LOC105176695 isoform X2 n=1 Tax=Sesamum indicum TaxID=4182 RepID=A0A6I9UH30_SESIN|nr:uncharacterized protein LOC105176695 isoform X2 [Sesamum indicum]